MSGLDARLVAERLGALRALLAPRDSFAAHAARNLAELRALLELTAHLQLGTPR